MGAVVIGDGRGTGWWAEETGDGWRPVLQLDGFTVTSRGPYFRTEDGCLAFIREHILDQGILP